MPSTTELLVADRGLQSACGIRRAADRAAQGSRIATKLPSIKTGISRTKMLPRADDSLEFAAVEQSRPMLMLTCAGS